MGAPKRLTAAEEILRLARGRDASVPIAITTGPPIESPGLTVHELDGEYHSDAADTTDLDATDAHHGLLPKLSGDPDTFLGGDGAWSVVESDAFYQHEQMVADDTWNVTHGLGKYPSVTVVDSGGNAVVGDVEYVDDNSVVITFSATFSGVAYLN